MDEQLPPPWEPPIAGDEVSALLGALERQRATLAWKCSGVDDVGIRTTVGTSSLTLGGLLKHLALVEAHQVDVKLLGRDLGPPWDGADPSDPDWALRVAPGDTPASLLALWREAVDRTRTIVADAIATGGLDQLASGWPDGGAPNLRRLLFDLLEEYARHVGHADLIRESIDGLTGEDPPG